MLQATEITLRYGKRQVLHDVNFGATRGAFSAIVGPNGSGKTSLMRALVGEESCGGRVLLEGYDVAHTNAWKLASIRAVLPQATPLAFPFTVAEVVRLGLNSGANPAGSDRAKQALERVGLSGFGGRFYQELSGGEQQRVQLARVLTQVWHPMEDGEARWLFLDEPVSSLDIGHQLLVMQIARDYANAGGGVVAVMHDLNLTAMFCDSVALLSQGRILAQGAPQAVLCNDMLSTAYGCQLRVNTPPAQGTYLLPHTASMAAE